MVVLIVVLVAVKPTPKKKERKRLDLSQSSMERNFITPVRAMSEFLLKPSDLESLPKTKRRSPYEYEPPITVYWRRDVEAKACEIWGSKENLEKELRKREIERKKYQQSKYLGVCRLFLILFLFFFIYIDIFTAKRRLRDFRREMGKSAESVLETETGLKGRSGRVVLTAVAMYVYIFAEDIRKIGHLCVFVSQLQKYYKYFIQNFLNKRI